MKVTGKGNTSDWKEQKTAIRFAYDTFSEYEKKYSGVNLALNCKSTNRAVENQAAMLAYLDSIVGKTMKANEFTTFSLLQLNKFSTKYGRRVVFKCEHSGKFKATKVYHTATKALDCKVSNRCTRVFDSR